MHTSRQIARTWCPQSSRTPNWTQFLHPRQRYLVQIRVNSFAEELDSIGETIAKLLKCDGYKESEIAILVRHSDWIDEIYNAMASKWGFKLSRVTTSRKNLADGVRIGTFEYTKGLEFRAVFMPCMAREIPNQTADNGCSESISGGSIQASLLQEAKTLEQGRLYAAITRARDRLCLIADDVPSEDIASAKKQFDWQDLTTE